VSYTKADIVSQALSELGLADYEFDITPDEVASGVRRLDQMMSMWADKGIRVPYNAGGDFGEDANIPASATEAVVTNLALRLASSYGKQVSMQVAANAKASLDSLMRISAWPVERQFRPMPKGAGHKVAVTNTYNFFSPDTNYPWDNAEFEDYLGGGSAIQVGDVGTVIKISLTGDIDISTAVATAIRYRKPSGATGEWPSTIVDNSLEYLTQAGDIDEAGVWSIQAFFDLTTWQGTSKVESITVGRSL